MMNKINVGRLETLEYIALDGVTSVCLTNYLYFLQNSAVCSIHSVKYKFDFYLSTVHDFPCQPRFNSLDYRDCLRWRTPRDGQAENKM